MGEPRCPDRPAISCTCPAVEAFLVQTASHQQNAESLWTMTPTDFIAKYVNSSKYNDEPDSDPLHFSQMAIDLVDDVVDDHNNAALNCDNDTGELQQFITIWKRSQDGPLTNSLESYAIRILSNLDIDAIAQSVDLAGPFAKVAEHATALASEILYVLASSITCKKCREKSVQCMSSIMAVDNLTPAALSAVGFCAQRCELEAEAMAAFISTSMACIEKIQVLQYEFESYYTIMVFSLRIYMHLIKKYILTL